jgi:thiosulfate/3-mercaptopyruvate sulfurtransferase
MLLSSFTKQSLKHHRALKRAFSTSSSAASKFLISTEELNEMLGDQNLTVLHATMNQPHVDWNEQHLMERIPGSVQFSINAISDLDSPYPHMLAD